MVETVVRAPFRKTTTKEGFSLQFELDPGFTTPPLTKVRLYPGDVNPKLVTNLGTVTRGGTLPADISREVLQFSGQDTATTRYPIISLGSLRVFGSVFDENGDPLPDVSFAQDGYLIRASEDVYGAIEVSYSTAYILLDYLPLTTVFPDGSTQNEFGSILAFYEGTVATFTVPLPSQREGDFQEVYRIVSEMVVNELGPWEKPPGWTGLTGSPTWPEGQPNPDDPSIRIERPHEIGYVTSQGSTFSRSFFVPNESPKKTEPFNPELGFKESPGGGPFDDQLERPQVQNFINAARERVT